MLYTLNIQREKPRSLYCGKTNLSYLALCLLSQHKTYSYTYTHGKILNIKKKLLLVAELSSRDFNKFWAMNGLWFWSLELQFVKHIQYMFRSIEHRLKVLNQLLNYIHDNYGLLHVTDDSFVMIDTNFCWIFHYVHSLCR